MKQIAKTIYNNKLYVVLFIFIVGINLLIFAEKMERKKASQTSQASISVSQVKKIFDEDEMKMRQQKLETLVQKNPPFYLFLAILNLFILFIMFLGLVIDIYFIIRYFRKKPIHIISSYQDKPRWGIGDIVRVALIFLSCGYIFVIFQSFLIKFFPILDNENFHMVFNTAIVNIVGISVILYFVIKKYQQNASAIGLTLKRFSTNFFYAIIGYIMMAPILVIIMIITFFVTKFFAYKPPVQPIVEIFMEERATGVLWFSAIFAAIFGPIAEEIFFRGFMYPAVRKRIGILWAMILTSVIFSFLHTHVVGFFPILVLGLLLAYLYEKTGSLIASISVHIIHNMGMLMLVFLMRYIGS